MLNISTIFSAFPYFQGCEFPDESRHKIPHSCNNKDSLVCWLVGEITTPIPLQAHPQTASAGSDVSWAALAETKLEVLPEVGTQRISLTSCPHHKVTFWYLNA